MENWHDHGPLWSVGQSELVAFVPIAAGHGLVAGHSHDGCQLLGWFSVVLAIRSTALSPLRHFALFFLSHLLFAFTRISQ